MSHILSRSPTRRSTQTQGPPFDIFFMFHYRCFGPEIVVAELKSVYKLFQVVSPMQRVHRLVQVNCILLHFVSTSTTIA
jgi:hypothetical protein